MEEKRNEKRRNRPPPSPRRADRSTSERAAGQAENAARSSLMISLTQPDDEQQV